MKRKWFIKFDRGWRLNRWFAKAGNRSTAAVSYFFWTPFGGCLEITGYERSIARYY